MNERSSLESVKKKLDGICDNHNLINKLIYDKYPISLVILPCKDPEGQMSMLESVEDNGRGYISPDASLTLYFEDGDLIKRVKGTFDMDGTLEGKIENLFKKIHYFYLQVFHRELINSPYLKFIPRITGNAVPTAAQPVESYEQVDMDEAIRIVRTNNYITAEMLQSQMHLSTDDADSLLNELELDGVIGAEKEDGTYDVLPWDEPDDEQGSAEEGAE